MACFGGDEFVIALGKFDPDREQSLAQMSTVAKKILTALAVKFPVKDQFIEYSSSLSVGCKLFDDEQE